MTTIRELNKVNTLDELEALGIGRVDYEMSYRGGNLGFNGAVVAEKFNINPNHMPRNFGAYCNYLGGGVRGTVNPSTFSDKVPEAKAKRLRALAEACVRVFDDIENEIGLNDTEDEDGETNWDALATQGARNSGIVSGY